MNLAFPDTASVPDSAVEFNRNSSEEHEKPVSPQLSNLKARLQRFEKDKLLAMHKKHFILWKNGMVLSPKSGNVYLIKAPMGHAKIIANSDGLCWKNVGLTKSGQREMIYHAAVPATTNIAKDTQSGDLVNNQKIAIKDVSYRKTFTFDQISKTFLIEYFGDDTEYTWKRKIYKTPRNFGKKKMVQT